MPLDLDILEFSSRFTGRLAQKSPGRLDEDIFAFTESLEVPDEPVRDKLTGAQQEEMEIAAQEEAQMQQARAKLERSPLPDFYAFGVQAGAPIVSGIARLLGKGAYADTMTRTAARIEQAQREREEGGPIPDILQSGLRGAGASLTQMFGAGMVGGPTAAIGAASAFEANRALTEAEDAGKTGTDRVAYAVGQGVIEGLPAAFMQRIGLGGMESLVGKRAVTTGVKDALKKFGVQFAAEHGEEQVTEHTHNIMSALSGVDPEALSPESIRQTAYETAVQTTLAMGLGHTLRAGKPLNITEIHAEMEAYAKEGKVPSRRVYNRWNLGPGLPGDSIPQRRAFILELGKRLAIDEAAAREAPEAPVTPVEAEGVLAPEEGQLGLGPPREAPGLALDPQSEAELALEPQVESDLGLEAPAAVPTLAPQEGDDSIVALNKAESNKILEGLGKSPLEDPGTRGFPEVMAAVSVAKADENILGTAAQIVKNRRGGSDFEHAAMLLKAGKLMNELDQAQVEQAEAAARGDVKAHERITARIEGKLVGEYKQRGIVSDIEMLARADAYAGTESARALSIRRLALSRESFDVVDIIQKLQASKGPKGGPISPEEERRAAEDSKKIKELQTELEQIKAEIQAEDEAKAKTEAQRVLNAVKKKSFGKVIKEKAATEREDIKAQIRALGHRVNDITGVSAEGIYLIGRLGVSYIKSGVGTLVELAEQLRSDMPDLNLTDYDVWQALVARNPKLKVRMRTEAEKKVIQLKSMSRMLVEIEDMANGIAAEKPVRVSNVTQEMKALRKRLTKAREMFYESEIDRAKFERAITTVNHLQDLLDTGKKRIKKVPKEVPPELGEVREQARQLRAELRVDEELVNVNRQLKTGEFDMPVQRVKKPINPRLERKQIELARKKKELRQWIADAAPWDTVRAVKEVASLMKAMKATADVSFTMRQNLWQVFAHPVRTSKAFVPSLEALFSEYSSDQIYNSMVNGPNGFLYEKSGLAILDPDSASNRERSEIFRSNVIERSKLPGLKQWGWVMKAASRHAVAIGNLVRTSAFDQFIANHPNATSEELAAFADYLNVSTGIGNLGRFSAVGDELQTVFFSPKFAVSRFQTPLALKKHWQQPRVRKEVAKDMVKFVSTSGIVVLLAKLAGFSVELFDPDDPDWFKIRIGDTRWDVFGGILQPARLIAKNAKAIFTGGADFTPAESLGRFASYKFAPIVTTLVEFLKGKTAVGEETAERAPQILKDVAGEKIAGQVTTLAKIPVPFVYEDIYDAWKEEGAAMAAGAAAGTLLGVGVGTYKDSESATRRKIKNLKKRGKHSQAAQLRWAYNREHPKRQIRTVKVD
jgi:hypothetical protein